MAFLRGRKPVSNAISMPLPLREVLGPIADDIVEEIGLSNRVAYIEQSQTKGFFGRVKAAFQLAATGKASMPRGSMSEKTYRGPSRQAYMPFVGEFKPTDYLTPEIVDQMKKNGVIKTGLFIKKAPILGVLAKFRIKHENPQVEAYLNHVMKDLLFEIVQSSLYAFDYGISLHEKVFEAEKISFKYQLNGKTRTFNGNSIHYKKIKWNNPRTIKRINIQEGTQDYDGYVQMDGYGENVIPLFKSFMWGRYQENSLWGNSDLDAVYEYWYWLEILSGYFMRYLEKLGTPPMVGYAPPGTTYSRDEGNVVENMTWLADLAGRLQDGMAIVMPSVFDGNSRNRLWELKEMPISNRGDLHKMAIEWLENSIFKGLFVPDKPVSSHSSGQHGSYALADVQFEAFLIGLEWDIRSLTNNIEKYVLRPLIDLNFGQNIADAELFYPPLSREFKQRVYDIFVTLIHGHPDYDAINFKTIADELGIPLYTEEELVSKREEKIAEAKAMMEATTPPQPAFAPTPNKPESK